MLVQCYCRCRWACPILNSSPGTEVVVGHVNVVQPCCAKDVDDDDAVGVDEVEEACGGV